MTEYAIEHKIDNQKIIDFFSQYFDIDNHKISVKKSLNEHFNLLEKDTGYDPDFTCINETLDKGFLTYLWIHPDRQLGDEDRLSQAMSSFFNSRVLLNCYDEEAMYGFYLFVPNGSKKQYIDVEAEPFDEEGYYILAGDNDLPDNKRYVVG